MYSKQEYEVRALLLSPKPSLLAKLDAVYHGLESKLNIDSSPLSLKRILGLSLEDQEYLHGKTVYQALTDDQVTIDRLKVLKNYGKTLITLGSLFSQIGIREDGLSNIGNLIYSLSIAQAYNKFREPISRQEPNELRTMFDEMSELPFVVPTLKEILESASLYVVANQGLMDSPVAEYNPEEPVH